jgi:hypothetical protein
MLRCYDVLCRSGSGFRSLMELLLWLLSLAVVVVVTTRQRIICLARMALAVLIRWMARPLALNSLGVRRRRMPSTLHRVLPLSAVRLCAVEFVSKR